MRAVVSLSLTELPGLNREQFSIPQATPAYEDIVRQLPAEFVGPAPSKAFPLDRSERCHPKVIQN